MNIIFESLTDHKQNVSDTQRKSGPPVSHFFETQHQLILWFQEGATSEKTARAVEIINRRPQPLRAAPAVAEQALYWMISAPALAYLLYLIFGL